MVEEVEVLLELVWSESRRAPQKKRSPRVELSRLERTKQGRDNKPGVWPALRARVLPTVLRRGTTDFAWFTINSSFESRRQKKGKIFQSVNAFQNPPSHL